MNFMSEFFKDHEDPRSGDNDYYQIYSKWYEKKITSHVTYNNNMIIVMIMIIATVEGMNSERLIWQLAIRHLIEWIQLCYNSIKKLMEIEKCQVGPFGVVVWYFVWQVSLIWENGGAANDYRTLPCWAWSDENVKLSPGFDPKSVEIAFQWATVATHSIHHLPPPPPPLTNRFSKQRKKGQTHFINYFQRSTSTCSQQPSDLIHLEIDDSFDNYKRCY